MDWFWFICFLITAVCAFYFWVTGWYLRDDRDYERGRADAYLRDKKRNRKMAEWLAGEAVRAFKLFERIGGVIDDGPVTKELILEAAAEAVEEDGDDE